MRYYVTDQDGVLSVYTSKRTTPTGRVVLSNGYGYRVVDNGGLTAVLGKAKPHTLQLETPELVAKHAIQSLYLSAFIKLENEVKTMSSNFAKWHATQEKIDIINECISKLKGAR